MTKGGCGGALDRLRGWLRHIFKGRKGEKSRRIKRANQKWKVLGYFIEEKRVVSRGERYLHHAAFGFSLAQLYTKMEKGK